MLLYSLKLNCLIFFYQFKQLTDYIHTDIYCKVSKCIGQTYEHYLVNIAIFLHLRTTKYKFNPSVQAISNYLCLT